MANTPTQNNYQSKKDTFSKITDTLNKSSENLSYEREETQMSNAELLALLNSQDEEGLGWNNPFFYLIFIWLFAMFGGAGFGGFRGGSAAMQEISNDFVYSNLNMGQEHLRNAVSGVQQGICSSTYELASKIDQNRYDASLEAQALSRQIADCCCTTQRNIDALANQVTMDTCAIKEAIFRDGEATRALINANTMQELRDQLQAAQLTLGNNAQTSAITAMVDERINSIIGYPARQPLWGFGWPYYHPCPSSSSSTQG